MTKTDEMIEKRLKGLQDIFFSKYSGQRRGEEVVAYFQFTMNEIAKVAQSEERARIMEMLPEEKSLNDHQFFHGYKPNAQILDMCIGYNRCLVDVEALINNNKER